MFASRICEPDSSRVSKVWALTVAWVPTGMKSGVFTSLCSVRNVAARAREPVATASSLKLSREGSMCAEGLGTNPAQGKDAGGRLERPGAAPGPHFWRTNRSISSPLALMARSSKRLGVRSSTENEWSVS